jgi:WD40 repeat protein
MKAIVTADSMPLHRAFCTLLIGIAALWAMPRSARAQLYVSQTGSGANTGTVSEYDATTGAVINANLITGVGQAGAIFLSGNTLYVANASAAGTVGDYNATTGAAINANLITGLDSTAGLLLSGNILYVANRDPSTVQPRVGAYNATTGAVINATLITGLGLNSTPAGLVLSGNNLLVADSFDHVQEYNATTGAAINTSFITMPGVDAILLSGNTLYAASASNSGLISEYNATTGAAINTNFIVNGGENVGLALSGNDLFVSRQGAVTPGTVSEYNATTGALIAANFVPPLATPIFANGIAVASVPEPSTWSMIAIGGVALLGMMLRKKHRTA